jgi:hypothetical protein
MGGEVRFYPRVEAWGFLLPNDLQRQTVGATLKTLTRYTTLDRAHLTYADIRPFTGQSDTMKVTVDT